MTRARWLGAVALAIVINGILGYAVWRHERGAGSPESPLEPLPEPLLAPNPIELDAAMSDDFEAALAQLNQTLATGEPEAALNNFGDFDNGFLSWVKERASAGVRIEVKTVHVRHPAGDQLDLVAYSSNRFGQTVTYELPRHFAYRRGDTWRVAWYRSLVAYVGPRITRMTGAMWVAPKREWWHADLELAVDTGGRDTLLFKLLPMRETGREAITSDFDLRLLEISQDGEPCQFFLHGAKLFVRPVRPDTHLTLRIRYEGALMYDKWAHVSAAGAFLAGGTPDTWDSEPDYDIRVFYPKDATLLASAAVEPDRGAPPGWRVGRVVSDSSARFAALVGRFEKPQEVRAGSLTVRVHSEGPGDRDIIDKHLGAALAALEPLGRYPRTELDLAIFGFESISGTHTGRLITLSRYRSYARVLIAHELAHVWFGGVIRTGTNMVSKWWEAVTEYVATWALSPEYALSIRKERWQQYNDIAPADDVALTRTRPISTKARAGLSYGKGFLLMVALEQEIGVDAMRVFLRALIARYRGQSPDWYDLVATLGETHGDDPAAWLRDWLERPGAPELRLTDPHFAGNDFTATLQQVDTEFRGHVEICQFRADESHVGRALLEKVRVAFGPGATQVRFALRPDARWIVLDPEFRLPMRRTEPGHITIERPAAEAQVEQGAADRP